MAPRCFVSSSKNPWQFEPASVHGHAELVAHVGTAYPENDVGGDVRSMIGDALKGPRDKQAVHCLLGDFWIFLHELEQVSEGAAVHAVDFIVHLAHGVGETGI